ncbi:DUF445 domain-containing protein [Acidocella sp. KAb 2-4]|uniref:DUF445 domain-containing protein n=1 Tax=Acidocella sp. KAb 2-4 TaxID=2885158 RepID=UPI001D095346|nr:DUF445 domain-containing protein [Acidocella sp. KAb 2-4]MCB5943373.1 DUF445 domain-containing protein [Acidocella sp. KAb 2-4]
MTQDSDASLRASLTRHRLFASSLLGLMAALTLLGYWLPLSPWSALLRDAAKAGFIGGVADWFAVTALFRHPLGLPIPHTAILPAQKERLGNALGRFVANHVFTEADIRKVLANLDAPAILRRFLTDSTATRPLAEALAGMLPKLLASIEDGRARRLLARLLPKLAGGRAAGVVVARALAGLVEGGRHQEVFSFILSQLKDTLATREEILRDAIKERVREQGGKLVGWALGATVANRVLTAVNAELDRIGPDSSEIREAFDEWAHREIARLETDPERAAELGRALRAVLSHDTVKAWAWDVWARMRHALEVDAANPHGRSVAVIEAALVHLSDVLEKDEAAQQRVNAAAQALVLRMLPGAQAEGAKFIGRVIGAWDTATITEKLELRVGKDLQYIRVNGTLVGFFLGAAINLALAALHLG